MTRRTGRVVCDITISVDGYSAGLNQTEERPFGDDGGDGWGDKLHAWMETPEEHRAALDRMAAAKAFIMGRNMFGPVRGEWGTSDWTGWWGEDPPFHHDVFVLTHHARDPVPMAGGTTFHFVTDGIEAALDRATAAAGGRHVRLGGGVSTVHQYLRAGLLDELHVAVVPVLLGGGERLLDGLGGLAQDWACVEFAPSASVAHVRLRRR